jgi:hypothetical protein
MKQKDFLQYFRVGAWALVGVLLVVLVAIMIS